MSRQAHLVKYKCMLLETREPVHTNVLSNACSYFHIVLQSIIISLICINTKVCTTCSFVFSYDQYRSLC